MLQSIKQLYGKKLDASDGEIGHLNDFYFDDEGWVIRYVVADTGSWLPSRQVLVSPHVFGELHHAGKGIGVNLKRKQIEDCPTIEKHKPVSRQYEEEYYRYHGLPAYWLGDGLWGMSGIPILEDAPKTKKQEPGFGSAAPKLPDAHLRSTKAVTGYHLQASDGLSGQVHDFMMDTKSWAIRNLVVKIGNRFSGKEGPLPTAKVKRISYEESTVFVDLTMAEVEKCVAENLVEATV